VSEESENKYLKNLTELKIFKMVEFKDADLIIIAQNCPKLVKFIFDTEYCDKFTFDGIKAFVQECCSKDCIRHVDINSKFLKKIEPQDWKSLAKLVNETLPKIVIFNINHQNVMLKK
jgi:hypothetical protein